MTPPKSKAKAKSKRSSAAGDRRPSASGEAVRPLTKPSPTSKAREIGRTKPKSSARTKADPAAGDAFSKGRSSSRSRAANASAAPVDEARAAAEDASRAEPAAAAGSDGDDGDEDIVEAAAEIVDDAGSADEPVGVDEPVVDIPASPVSLTRLDPMQQYLREVQRHSLLTPDDEHALAVKYVGTGDVAAAARLVTANLRLVVKIAYEYRRAYKNIMDLVQEGNIGLMQAVKRYDPYRGVKLSSYAAWWIRAYILRFILNNWRLVKLGTTQAQRKLFFNLNKEKARLAAMGIEPTAAEIARRLGVEEQEVSDMDRRLSSGEMSLDAPVGDTEGRPVSRLEMMPTSATGPDTAVAEGEIQEMLRSKLADFRTTLKGKDVQIFDERLVAEDPLTLQELGDRFGISRERVRQLEARLTGRLREYLKSELGDAVAS